MVESSENKRQRPNVTFRVDEESDRKKIRADRPENELEEGYELDYLLEDGPFEQRSKRKSLKDQGTDSESAEEDQEASADSGDSISDGGSKSSASKDDTGRVMGEVLIQEHDYTEDGIKITPFNMAEELEDG